MSKPKIHLEFGIHSLTNEEIRETAERFADGNPDSNTWGWGVSKRIEDIAPDALYVDGLTGYERPYPDDTVDYTASVWQRVPKTAIKDHGAVRVYGGDSPDMYMDGDYIGLTETMSHVLYQYLANYAIGTVGYASVEAFIQKARNIGATGEPRINTTNDPLLPATSDPIQPKDRMSRRQLLNRGTRFGLLMALWPNLQNIPLNLLAELPIQEDTAMKVAILPSSFMRRATGGSIQDQWIDGRTALVIQKALHTAEVTGEETCVVLGSAHANLAHHLLDNPRARYDAIKKLAYIMFRSLDAEIVYSNGQPITAEDKLLFVRQGIATVSVHDVYKPYADDETSDDWSTSRLSEAVKYVGQYAVPTCMQIINDLGLAFTDPELEQLKLLG